jgi:mannose-6-phosphate isomerase-like protein (cupin superfamily)
MVTTTSIHTMRFELDGFPERLAIVEHSAARTVVEVELAPGGGVPLHVHRGYSESFEVLDGRLRIQHRDEQVTLGPGEQVTVTPNVPHNFANPFDAPVRFRVTLRDGQRGFLEMQLLFFGLRADGLVDDHGMPRDPRHAAVAFGWSDTAPADRRTAVMMRGFRQAARLTGEERRLRERYVVPAAAEIAAFGRV